MIGVVSFNQKTSFAQSLDKVKVIYSNVNVYLDYNNTQEVVKVVNYGDVLETNTNEIYTSSKQLDYYKVVINLENNKYGYILVSHTINTIYNSPKRELDHNAKITKKAYIYVKESEGICKTEKILKVGEKVKILSKEEDYSFIQYLDSENNIVSCYIKSDCVRVKGISRSTISAIVIIATTISLVLIIFGVTNKKGKKSRLFKNK